MAAIAGLAALVGFLTRAGLSYHKVNCTVSTIYLVLSQIWLPLGWMAAAAGFGVWVAHALKVRRAGASGEGSPWEWMPGLGIGVAVLLWLDRALGAIGLLQAAGGAGAWMVLTAGWCGLGGWGWSQRARSPEKMPRTPDGGRAPMLLLWLPALPALAVLVVACCSIPGWLWDSEFAGYDVLEYHLQLPAEWLAAGRIVPPVHNVYGHLPSFVESAYYHVAVLYDSLPEALFEQGSTSIRLNAAVQAAIACQMLHGLMTLAAAGAVACLVWRCLGPDHALSDRIRSLAATLAFCLTLSVPWTVVTGSMAYNEMAVVLMLALALAMVVPTWGQARVYPLPHGAVVGLLVGTACGAKLTSAGFVAAPVITAVFIAHRARYRSFDRSASLRLCALTGTGCVLAVVVTLGPWLVQNAIVTHGNPLFPFAAGVFGSWNWTPAQVQRWDAAHIVSLSTGQRMRRVGSELILHRQYAGLWGIGLLGFVAMWIRCTRTRLVVCMTLTACVTLQVLFWLTRTHLESRFLIPAIVPLVTAVSLSLAWLSRRSAAVLAGMFALPTAMSVLTYLVYLQQQDGQPASLIDGVGLRTGQAWQGLPAEKQQELASVYYEGFINQVLKPDDVVFLIGDATPFYINTPRVVWNTTWDTSLFGDVVAEAPGNPDRWAVLLAERGIDYVLVNYAELYRLISVDGWYDDRVTIDAVRALVHAHGRLVMSWPEKQPVRFLYRLMQ